MSTPIKPKKQITFEKIDWDFSKHFDLWQVTTKDFEAENKEKLGKKIASEISKLVEKTEVMINGRI